MVLEQMSELVDALGTDLDGGELRAAIAVQDRLDARISLSVAAFETAGRYTGDGAVSMRGWLRQETGRDACTAGQMCSTGRKLRLLPVLAAAVLEGEITGGQLDVILAKVPRRHVPMFAEHEADVVPTLAALTVDQTRRAMDEWKRLADAVDPGRLAGEHDNQLHLSPTFEGRGELRGSFDPDTTAVIEAALRVADPKDYQRSLAERRADALAQICQHFVDHQQTRRGGRHRPHLNVAINLEDLEAGTGGRYLDTDQPVSPAGLGVLLCDSAFHRVLFSATSGILDYGRATRAWPVDLYNAIAVRDGGCRFGACDAPPSWCDVHHVDLWDHGGETSVTNGIMGCRRHHKMIHQPGYAVKLLPDGTVEFTHPTGRVETSHPRGTAGPTLFRRKPDGS